jgi:hypothetical protein
MTSIPISIENRVLVCLHIVILVPYDFFHSITFTQLYHYLLIVLLLFSVYPTSRDSRHSKFQISCRFPVSCVVANNLSKTEALRGTGFYGEERVGPKTSPTLEDLLLSAVRDYLFNIFAVTPLQLESVSFIRNLRMRHDAMTR